MTEQHKNICLFCSLGCGFIIETAFDEAINLEYDRQDPVNRGTLCSKGNYMLELINHPLRLIEPKAGGKTLNWKDVFSTIASKLKPYTGTTSAGLILEGDASIEDVMTARLFAEKCLGNDRIAIHFATGDDRVYRALTAARISISPVRRDDIEKSECIIAIGDPFEVGPDIAGGVLAAKYARRGNVCAVVSKKPNRTSRFATVHLAGSERKTLAGFLRAVVEHSDGDSPGWTNVVKDTYPLPENPSVMETAKTFVQTPSAVMILETQDPVTAELAGAIVAATTPGKKLYFVSSYGNTGGICDVFEGKCTVEDLLDAAEHGELKTLIVLGADIIRGVSGRTVKPALEKLDCLIAGAPFENETTGIAHLILPTALWLEAEGTYNGKSLDRVIEPPGEALPYGSILRRLASEMGTPLPPVSRESVPGGGELTGELMPALLKECEKDAPEPAIRSTTISYADGSLTDNMSWIQLQEREAW